MKSVYKLTLFLVMVNVLMLIGLDVAGFQKAIDYLGYYAILLILMLIILPSEGE